MRRLIAPVLVTGLVGPGLALAQELPRWEIGAGATLGVWPADAECGFGDCSPGSAGWVVTPAYYLTDRIAVVGQVAGSYSTLEPIADELPLAIDVSFSQYSFGGGIRVTGSRARRLRPFAQAIVSSNRLNVDVSVLGLGESDSAYGVAIEPGGGVDVSIAKRLAIRLQGGYGIGFSEGESSRLGWVVGAGVVFKF